jgi:hypothetical protein
MNDVPLVKANNIHDINTSIIAIKKQLKQLNEAVGLIDMPTIDTSIFVKKSEVVDVVEEGNMNPVTSNAVVPVDEVTSGNMQSVSSNAVSKALSYATEEHFTGKYYYDGKPIFERVFLLEHLVNSGDEVRFDVSNVLDYITKVDFITSKIVGANIWQFFHQGAWGTGFDWMITYYRENNQLVIKYGTAYVNWNFVLQVSVEYTKY